MNFWDPIYGNPQEGYQVYGVSKANHHCHSDRNNRSQQPPAQLFEMVEERHLGQESAAYDRSFNQNPASLTAVVTPTRFSTKPANVRRNRRHRSLLVRPILCQAFGRSPFGAKICSMGFSNSFATLNASVRLGSYFSVSIALMVWRDTPSLAARSA